MAEIVVGIAASHTPQLSSGADLWADHGRRDRGMARLLGHDGEYHGFDELAAAADPAIAAELGAVRGPVQRRLRGDGPAGRAAGRQTAVAGLRGRER